MWKWVVSLLVVVAFSHGAAWAENGDWAAPADEDRPWVYWFWKNGNISREGITADLEAMQRVGIGGVIMMEVSLSVPPGPYKFFSPEWRELFKYTVAEAARLGLQVSVNLAPGWTGSGGPWVKPEESMQKVVASEIEVTGPMHFDGVLPQPETVQGFYGDIAVLAFPTPEGNYRIPDIREKALYERGPISSMPGVRPAFTAHAEYETISSAQAIAQDRILDISPAMEATGRLAWDVPAGQWTIMRLGHTSTGQTNRPAPLPGLECDKLDPEALDRHFAEFTAALVADVGPLAGKTLVATHLDSWEVGAQNWTTQFREEFQKRRGYDLLPFLPAMTGRAVGDVERSERFLWDLRKTASEMLIEYHGRHLRELAAEHGLWLSIEPYDMTPCDDMMLGACADVPMCEFWINTFDTRYSVKEATSIAHVYGRNLVAAESFTSIDRWLAHPGSIKAVGDWAFSEGVNRFVIHRSIHQSFVQARPGLSLGPHGLHYERTNTWWEYARPWHTYLARCQHALKKGQPVADLLYLSPEGAPNVFQSPDPAPEGYKFDACTTEALLTRINVRDGLLETLDGARYRMLVLPQSEAMTPEMLARIAELVDAGATVAGAPPRKSPSLSGYPECDTQVQALADRIWGANTTPGRGRVIRLDVEQPKAETVQNEAIARASWIWHDTDSLAAPVGSAYFRRNVQVEGQVKSARAFFTADNDFRLYVNGREAGRGDNFNVLYAMDLKPLLQSGENVIAARCENGGAAPNPAGFVGAVCIEYEDGRTQTLCTDGDWSAASAPGKAWRTNAPGNAWVPARVVGTFGMDPWRTPRLPEPRRQIYPDSGAITAILKEMMKCPPDFESGAPLRFAHRVDGDMDIYFVSNGADDIVETACTFRVSGKAASLYHPETGAERVLPELSATADGRTVVPLRFEPAESYFIVFRPAADAAEPEGHNFPALAQAGEVAGPWNVRFDPALGGPADAVVFDNLEDWAQRPEEGIRYYSGTAAYTTTFAVANDMPLPEYLDLGRVEVMAQVSLNGHDLGIVWKKPYRVFLGDSVRAGVNELDVRVVNLWPNRMIGDEKLEPDSDRNENGTLKAWPQWLLDGKSSPTGRINFATWRHWTAEDELLPSGLLGPVVLLRAE